MSGFVRLDPEQLEQLADLVAERLRTAAQAAQAAQAPATPASSNPPLVDAATLARQLGVSRRYVYEHSGDLGAIRLGTGEKAPLRFDPDAALAAMRCLAGERSHADIPSTGRRSEHSSPRKPVHLPTRRPKPGRVLAVRGGPRRSSGSPAGAGPQRDVERKEAA